MSSAAELEPYFSPAVKVRGLSLFRSGAVNIEPRQGGWRGTVQGTQRYDILLDLSRPDDEVLYCSCPAYRSNPPCKHLWASLLEMDRSAGRVGVEYEALPSQSEFDWRGRLAVLDSVAEDEPLPREFHGVVAYLIDVVESHHCNGLVIQPVVQKRMKNGTLGKLQRLHVGSREFESLPLLDRQILTAIESRIVKDLEMLAWGEVEARDPWVPTDLLPMILPFLADSERVYAWHRATGGRALPTAFGDPVRFELDARAVLRVRHVREAPSARVRIQSELWVNGEEIALSADPLLFGDRFVYDRGRVFVLEGLDAQGLGRVLIRDGAIEVPAHEESALLATVLALPGASALESDHLEIVEGVDPVPHLDLFDPPDPTSRRTMIDGTLCFEYGDVEVKAQDTRTLLPQDEGRLLRRDPDKERVHLDTFELLGGVVTGDGAAQPPALPMKRFEPVVFELVKAGWKITVRGSKLRKGSTPRVSVVSGKDWFDLDVEMWFGNQPLKLPSLLEAVKANSCTIRLDDGSLGILPSSWLQSWEQLFGLGAVEDGRIRLKANQSWVFDALLAACPETEYQTDADFDRLRASLAAVHRSKPKSAPRSFRGELRPYQRVGLGWLHFLRQAGFGGCLADDMGLGKTVQVLALLESRRILRERPSLVVVPSSLVFNWREEAFRFTPQMRVLEFVGAKRWSLLADGDTESNAGPLRAFLEYDIVLTTYGTLRRDIARYAEFEWDYVILDEAQAIKNHLSQASKATRILRAQHRLALSGTPIENHFGELWAQFEFLNPGMLGRSSLFQDMLKKKDSVPEAERLAALEQLGRAISPFILRRKKEEVLDDLPAKTEHTLYCDMPPAQRKSYDEVRLHYQRVLLKGSSKEDLASKKIHVLEALLRLRQAACHPGLLDDRRQAEACAKFEVLVPMLKELVAGGHKALVFSQFTSLLALLKPLLDASGLRYEYLDGRTRKRQARVEAFQSDPDCPLFLISIKAGGHGLNLTAADYVFILDPWWNPAVEAQAVDRAHRIGQQQKVMAYRLLCRDSVEERVAELQADKQQLADAILNADRSLLQALTPEDLAVLLG